MNENIDDKIISRLEALKSINYDVPKEERRAARQ